MATRSVHDKGRNRNDHGGKREKTESAKVFEKRQPGRQNRKGEYAKKKVLGGSCP